VSDEGTEAIPVIDTAVLQRLRDLGGESLLARMIDLFLENAPTRVRAAGTAAVEDDAHALEHAVHSLRSSAANLGASRLQAMAGRIETHTRAGELAPAVALVPRLEPLFDEARAILHATREELDS
jgi:HPt (histidine-containing phosphotransfer) domain-containing protein